MQGSLEAHGSQTVEHRSARVTGSTGVPKSGDLEVTSGTELQEYWRHFGHGVHRIQRVTEGTWIQGYLKTEVPDTGRGSR